MQPGRVLGKAYRVERALGAGGVGAVFEAVQVRTGRRYAVKVLLPEIAMREGAAKRFRREAEALAAVGHSGIVQIHDFDTEDDGTQFLVMDLLEGEDLATRIAREGALDLPLALRVLEEIGAALGAAHELGIVHRDLKPANVFLSRRPGAAERATILDFGLAKNLAGPSVHLTATGVGLGTPLYMSPEQARGEDVDLRTDVYALGCILFEMLTGNAPFTGATISIVIAKILTEEPPLVSSLAKRPTPPALDQVVRTALAKSASDRYPSARAFLDAVHRAAGDSSDRALAATAVSPGAPAPRALTPQALPLTREGLEAVPSIRPAAIATSEETTRPIETRPAPPPSPWPWIAVGVLVTLGVGGGLALTWGSFDHSASEQETVSASEASETRAVDHVLAIDRAVVEPAPSSAPPLEEQPSVAEPAIEATPRTPIERAPHAARARPVAPSDELPIAPS
ncbi:MAG: protein kinase, partial [Deltaproteobacteria bacterium]|nr:protein kinase [Deltaproteobacteria bacterium]